MEKFKTVVLCLAGVLWTIVCFTLQAVAFVLEIVSHCFLFFLVGFTAGRISND